MLLTNVYAKMWPMINKLHLNGEENTYKYLVGTINTWQEAILGAFPSVLNCTDMSFVDTLEIMTLSWLL